MKHADSTRPFLSLALLLALGACGDRSVSTQDESDTGSASTSDASAGSSVSGDASEASTTSGSSETAVTSPTDDTDTFTSESGNMEPCESPCDADTLEGCVEGQKCVPMECFSSSVWDVYGCIDIMGNDQLDEPCQIYGEAYAGADSCDEGLICLGNEGSGTCHALCLGTLDDLDALECPPGSQCVITSNGVQRICIPACNPLLEDCAEGSLCVPSTSDQTFVCVLDASGGTAPYGTACSYVNTCNSGLACIDASAVPEASCEGQPGCCSPFCDLDGPAACPGAGQTCQAWFAEPVPGLENVGVCAL